MPDDRPESPDPRVDVLATWLYEFYCEAGGTTMAAPATSLDTWRRAQFRGSARRALTVIDAALSTPAGPSPERAGTYDAEPAEPSKWSAPEETRERAMQAAIDKAHGAMGASEYVGGPTEREAWRTVLDALCPFVTQHKAATTKEGR